MNSSDGYYLELPIRDELQNLVRVREEARRPIPTPRRRIPDLAPRKMGVKQLIRFFENNPIPPYRPIPAPRTKKQQPVPASKTRIGEKRRALKGFTKSYKIGLKSDRCAGAVTKYEIGN